MAESCGEGLPKAAEISPAIQTRFPALQVDLPPTGLHFPPQKMCRCFIPRSTARSGISMPCQALGSSTLLSPGCCGARNARLLSSLASPPLKATPSSLPGPEQREQADAEVRPPGRRWEIRVPSRGPAGGRGGTGGDAHRQRYLLLSYRCSIPPSRCFVPGAPTARLAKLSPRMFAYGANPTRSWILPFRQYEGIRVLRSFAWRCMG